VITHLGIWAVSGLLRSSYHPMSNTWDEDDKMDYILSRTGKNVRVSIQTGYFKDEYSTAQEMTQVLASTYDDPTQEDEGPCYVP
jgi:hypothetical protein